MAQEPEAGRNASGVARTGKRKWGYDLRRWTLFWSVRTCCMRAKAFS